MKRIRKVFEKDEHSNWKVVDNSLQKEFKFNTFLEALGFVNGIAHLCEEVDHHPDIEWNFTKVTLKLKTYDVDRITDKDYDLAKRIDDLEILD